MSHQPLRLTVVGLAIAAITAVVAPAASADPLPVLLVIAERDYWHSEYAGLRASIEARGLHVVVAAATRADAVPQDTRLTRPVRADVLITEVDASGYAAIAFVGGWGASSYQYASAGTYGATFYRPDGPIVAAVNRLIGDFIAQDKPVAGLSHGVTVLAWARVDGVSPLAGRTVAGYGGGGPAFERDGTSYPDSSVPTRTQLEENGARVKLPGAIGDPLSSHDDVWVDGLIITGENPVSADALGRVLTKAILSR